MHFTATAKTATGTETVLRSESPAPALPERLAQAFAALDLAGLDYCLLRGAEELYGAGDLEIDVLVAAAHLAAFSHVLQECGFASLPTWGHAPHHFYQGYDRQQGRWLKFDAVTVLRFGHPVRSLQIDLATEYLRQRQRTAGIFTLAPGDEFFALLLHGLLDKRDFRSVRKQRLIELWYCVTAQAEANEVLRKRVASYLQPALHVEDLARACAAGDFHGVLARQARLVQRLTRGQRATHAWRRFTAQATRRMRPLLFALRRPGVSLALLAPDGAGKSTLAMALQRDAGLRARVIYMGTNVAASTIGLPTTKWLHRRLKVQEGAARPFKLTRLALKPLNYCNRMVERWYRSAYAVWQRRRGRVVVFDRYIYDAWVAKPATTMMKRLRRALLARGWPNPDLVVFLDAPAELLYARKGEHSVAWLEQQRTAYLSLQARLPQMHVIDATQSAEMVKREVVALIWNTYCSRDAQVRPRAALAHARPGQNRAAPAPQRVNGL